MGQFSNDARGKNSALPAIGETIRLAHQPEGSSTLVVFHLGAFEAEQTRRLGFNRDGEIAVVRLERVPTGIASIWMAHCPANCGRRVRILYFPDHRFPIVACRECSGLTYITAQERDKRMDQARRDWFRATPAGTTLGFSAVAASYHYSRGRRGDPAQNRQ